MQGLWPRRMHGLPARVSIATVAFLLVPTLVAMALLGGCASPGPPRPPSLQLPRLVSDLAATRSGDAVTLRFTVSPRTTDGQPLRVKTIHGSLCRQIAGDARCLPVDEAETRTPLNVPAGTIPDPVVWTDVLPSALASGVPRAMAYRLELKNNLGKSAGLSDPVYAAAGAAPPAVAGLRAHGTRLGIQLAWQPVPGAGEVLLERIQPASAKQPAGLPAHEKGGKAHHSVTAISGHKGEGVPGVVWLQAAPGDRSPTGSMDASIAEGVPYRYVAVRRQTVQLGGHTLELRSEPSPAVALAWRDIYPPPSPTGVTALGYFMPSAANPASPLQNPPSSQTSVTQDQAKSYAVDLIWQPVSDTRLAGYLVYRQLLGNSDESAGAREKLTPEPLAAPGFHDATALPEARYRYSVSAIDPKGNESPTAAAIVEPSLAP
ncbi:MAG: hypothetical protein ACRYFU_07135 [Janthinobacterium lividum]